MKKKGIILAGGLGTRLFPITLSVTKPLLPIYDKPMIYYPLATMMQAKIQDVLLIVREQDKQHFHDLLGDGQFLGMNISYQIEKEPMGIAPSFIIGEEFIGNDSVCLILGDNIFHGKQLKANFKDVLALDKGAYVFAKEVSDPQKYGVIQKDEFGRVKNLLEKPKVPPSNYAVTGLYFFDNSVVEIAKSITPSSRGEYEITDINNVYLKNNLLHVTILGDDIQWFDAGSFSSLMGASTYVQKVQEESNDLVGGVEWIAYENGWISKEDLEKLLLKYQKSGYGERLRSLLLL